MLAVLAGAATLVVAYELVYGDVGKLLPCRRKEDENEDDELKVCGARRTLLWIVHRLPCE